MVPLIERFILSYIEQHPEVLERVVHALIDRLVEELLKASTPATR